MVLKRRAVLTSMITLLGLASCPVLTSASNGFPNQPINLIVPFQPGGGTDAIARTFAKVSANYFPKGMVVLNKAGAGGAVGWKYVLNQKADGYTLAVVTGEQTRLTSQ